MTRSGAMGPSMIGELLYHLHRHFRLFLIAGGLALLVATAMFGYGVARHWLEPAARPAEAGQA